MAFFTRPHFEDRQFIQYEGESITLSGNTIIGSSAQLITNPTYLNNLSDNGNGVFSGLTSSTTVSTLIGELISGRVSGLKVQPPILNLLDASGNTTGTTVIDVTGYVLTSYDSGGTVTWDTVSSLSADTNTYTIDGTLIGNNISFDTNSTLSAYTVDISGIIPTGTTKYSTTTNFVANTPKTITHNLGVGNELSISLVDTTTNEIIGGFINNLQTNEFDVEFSVGFSSVKVVAIAGGITSGVNFTGGSGSCISDLYVTNIHGCSPITINDTLNFNISGSSTFFTDTNTNLDIGIDEDTVNGDLFKIYFGSSYFGIRNTGSTNTVESVFFGNDSLGDVLKVTTDGIVVEQEITSTIYDMGTISGSTNLDIRNGNLQTLTLNGNLTLNALSASTTEGGFLTVYVSQDGVGGHTLTKGTNILTESGAAISITSGASTKDTLTFKTDNNGDYRLDNHTKDFS